MKTLGKTYGIQMWCYWEHIEEYVDNFGEMQPAKKLIINDANHFPNHTGMNQFIYVIINS
jgi:hypothetical protein